MSTRRTAPTDTLVENIGVALTSLRAAPLRSSLTVLGVVIGVATVVTMATLVRGVQRNIISQIEVAGPTTFYVLKAWSSTPLNPDRLPRHIRVRPDLTTLEARRIAALPEVDYAGIWGQIVGRLEFGGERTPQVAIFGADERFTEIQGGELTAGRWFTRQELTGGRAVVVINEQRARQLFGVLDPVGKQVQVAGRPAEVVGLYLPPANIFTPPGSEVGAIVPFVMADRQYTIDRTQALWIPVKPRAGVSADDAQAAVAVALREMRGLRPGDGDTFDLVAQDQILSTFEQLTGAFFLVMIVLASVALLVGGIGVMAVMMVSVTDRTQEIGLRRAVGATRRDILVQFLIEAGTLTGIGGVLGILVGMGGAALMAWALGLVPEIPTGIAAIAVVTSVGIGVVFGVIPARRAAQLDPVDALRYE
jgi:putative ABC transport system permease protein